ncbi:MAG: hypothetical protein K6U87_03185 [Firmicutes bacterium]|nr:hypothetical protein [Bacillota bacterium]
MTHAIYGAILSTALLTLTGTATPIGVSGHPVAVHRFELSHPSLDALRAGQAVRLTIGGHTVSVHAPANRATGLR